MEPARWPRLSKRVRQIIDDEINNQRDAKPDVVLETQGRIFQQVRKLAEQGHMLAVLPFRGPAAPKRGFEPPTKARRRDGEQESRDTGKGCDGAEGEVC